MGEQHGLTVCICKYDLVFVPGKQDIDLGYTNVNNKQTRKFVKQALAENASCPKLNNH